MSEKPDYYRVGKARFMTEAGKKRVREKMENRTRAPKLNIPLWAKTLGVVAGILGVVASLAITAAVIAGLVWLIGKAF